MKNIRIIKSKNYTRLPWKNGQGYTDQIEIFSDGSNFASGDFLWRLSTAPVTAPGPFSLFPQHQRFLVIVQGQGIDLFHGREKIFLPAFTPYQFSGSQSTRCELPFGPVVDFNFFWKADQMSADLKIVTIQQGQDFVWKGRAENNFLFVGDGQLEVGEHLLNQFDTLHEQGKADLTLKALNTVSHVICLSL